jgi:hypothetical protein
MGLLDNVVTATLFGLSDSYEMALLFRCLSGLFNGSLGVVKAYCRETTADEDLDALFSMIGTSWGLESCSAQS